MDGELTLPETNSKFAPENQWLGLMRFSFGLFLRGEPLGFQPPLDKTMGANTTTIAEP